MSRIQASRVVEELKERIAHLEGSANRKPVVLPFGIREIDARLPGGGLAYGALHEVAGGGAGTVDGAAAALFTAGIAARSKGKVLWCLTRPDLFFPAISQAGLHPDRVIFRWRAVSHAACASYPSVWTGGRAAGNFNLNELAACIERNISKCRAGYFNWIDGVGDCGLP